MNHRDSLSLLHVVYFAGRKSAPKDGFLTDEELRYWSEHFKIDDANNPQLPQSEFLVGKCKMVSSMFFTGNVCLLNFVKMSLAPFSDTFNN